MGKYFKYAIGEIVLVVIGILIALSINNWNEKQIEKKLLKQFLIEFREELKSNIEEFNWDLRDIKSQKLQKDQLLKNKRLDTIKLSSLEQYIETWHLDSSFNPIILRRFESSQIKNYGNYDSLFKGLQEFYGNQWPSFIIDKIIHNDAVDKEDDFWRYQQNSYEFEYSNGEDAIIEDSSERKKALIKLIRSPIARNILKTDYRRKERNRRRLENLKTNAEWYLGEINDILQ